MKRSSTVAQVTLGLLAAGLALVASCSNPASNSTPAATPAAAPVTSFISGNLIVSRTVYSGTASTVVVGAPLPVTMFAPNPTTSPSPTPVAVADGGFPEVFQNETPDASFGVTSPVYLDQLNPAGTVVQTIPIDATKISSSFSSKSELALNVSTDKSTLTFMGYVAPINTLDVSNANTPAVLDTTNPDQQTFSRAIAQVNLKTNALTVTPVYAYSGNNGRAVILDAANGDFLMVGNAGNGSAVPPMLNNLSANTGVQLLALGSSGTTTVVGAMQGTATSATGNQYGFALSPADKTGKDDNFRGLTVFNNTLYVTKGSGSNGVDTVYQVGTAGTLPTAATASTTPITILPGFNTAAAKTVVLGPHPFGIWFANATTLFVADEGDGLLIGATGKDTVNPGLQEWTLSGGTWTKVATYQAGLVNQSYTLTGPGTSWTVQADGLRNLTGKVNTDGSFTLYATTSTVSNDGTHDLGADPNEVVTITITPTSTPANTSFTVVKKALAGERLGGVALVP